MNGIVDNSGRALLTVSIRSTPEDDPTDIQAWVDTAFNGELVMPRRFIEAARLSQSAGIEARLADGKIVTLESFGCWLRWFDENRRIEVIASDGEFPLLGISLLLGHRLIVDYAQHSVAIE
jgi:clan AA aspartic protease